MIVLGGMIGVGLFMGFSLMIKWIGLLVLIVYIVLGVFLYLIMWVLGEMLYVDLNIGLFVKFVFEYIYFVFGYLMVWSNIFQFVVVGMSEMIVLGGYCWYWWLNLLDWILGLIVIVFLCVVNFILVKMFGILEIWFLFIKVVMIILMIIVGLGLIIFGIGNGGYLIGISNLWIYGGFFIGGVKGFVFVLVIVLVLY